MTEKQNLKFRSKSKCRFCILSCQVGPQFSINFFSQP
uniref:Uncharacterized protein n=1 Tax=Anguilla anguilla TaxID=7936 RepID=A0A0E9RN90_ANGAN